MVFIGGEDGIKWLSASLRGSAPAGHSGGRAEGRAGGPEGGIGGRWQIAPGSAVPGPVVGGGPTRPTRLSPYFPSKAEPDLPN